MPLKKQFLFLIKIFSRLQKAVGQVCRHSARTHPGGHARRQAGRKTQADHSVDGPQLGHAALLHAQQHPGPVRVGQRAPREQHPRVCVHHVSDLVLWRQSDRGESPRV